MGEKLQRNRKNKGEDTGWKNEATEEDRFSKPESQLVQYGAAVFTLTLVGELCLPVKSSVEAINVKHKRRATLVEATPVFARKANILAQGFSTSTCTQVKRGSH